MPAFDIPQSEWNGSVAALHRATARAGRNGRTDRTEAGVIVHGADALPWQHPWWTTGRWDALTNAWLVRVRPGLYGKGRWGELGRPDLVIGFDCGLLMYPTWKATILELRGSGVPFVITSFRGWEAAAEARLLAAVKATCLIAPEANPWASPAGKRSTTIANDVSFDNAFVSAWR